MKRITKFIALAVALLVLLAGCQFRDTSWVFELNDERVPAGAYILVLNDNLVRGANILIEEWLEWEEEYPDQERPPAIFDATPSEALNFEIEGMRLEDWALAETNNFFRQHFAVRTLLDRYDIEPDVLEMFFAIHAASSEYSQQEQMFREMGVGEGSLTFVYLSNASLGSLFRGLYEQGGPREIPEDEFAAYFEENFVAGQEIVFVKEEPVLTGEESEEERAEIVRAAQEANQELRELAESFLERLLSGEYTFEQLHYERDLMYSPDPSGVMLQPPGALDFVTRIEGAFLFNEAVIEGLPTLSVGEAGVFEDDWVIAVVRRLDLSDADQNVLDEERDEFLWGTRFEDDFMPLLEELGESLPIVTNQAAVNRYTPRFLMELIMG